MTHTEELVKEIMQTGFDVAMGGDAFKSEEENKQEQERQYDIAVKKYAKLLEQREATAHAVGRAEERKEYLQRVKKAVDFALLPDPNPYGVTVKLGRHNSVIKQMEHILTDSDSHTKEELWQRK